MLKLRRCAVHMIGMSVAAHSSKHCVCVCVCVKMVNGR